MGEETDPKKMKGMQECIMDLTSIRNSVSF